MHGRKGEVLLFCSVPDTIWDTKCNINNWEINSVHSHSYLLWRFFLTNTHISHALYNLLFCLGDWDLSLWLSYTDIDVSVCCGVNLIFYLRYFSFILYSVIANSPTVLHLAIVCSDKISIYIQIRFCLHRFANVRKSDKS
jgi:hypothetical protein